MMTVWLIIKMWVATMSISEASKVRVKRDLPTESPVSDHTFIPDHDTDRQPVAGAMYKRWGRQECPADSTELLYKGFAAGQHITHVGGGSNYLCLPAEPEWGNYNDAVQNHGLIYGAEYEVTYNAFDGLSSNGVTNIQNQNVPCAVCRSTRAASVVMIPAKRSCMSDWHMEYNGYLMSAHHANKGRTEYVCMDGRPEADPSGYRNEDGVLFYFVEGICGSLPCPPYVNGRELGCVVCTK